MKKGTKGFSTQAALVKQINGEVILNLSSDCVGVKISRNGNKFESRDSTDPIFVYSQNGYPILKVPLSEKDTDTPGQLIVRVYQFGALPSVGIVEITDE